MDTFENGKRDGSKITRSVGYILNYPFRWCYRSLCYYTNKQLLLFFSNGEYHENVAKNCIYLISATAQIKCAH